MSEWESVFGAWSQPPPTAEQERIERTVRAIRDALDDYALLKFVTKIFVQGSYRNRVNVRQDSDVDIGVLYTGGVFLPHYPAGTRAEDFGNSAADYSYAHFKNDLGQALERRFGNAVRRGDKAFDIHESGARVDADVVPLLEHRRYSASGNYICGVELRPDSGGAIVNWPERVFDEPHWPEQHYEHGVSKNQATGRRFKGVVRILKKLRSELEHRKNPAAVGVKGFLIECLVWNVPDSRFGYSTWTEDVRGALAHLWSNTRSDETCAEWGEVSELKHLFKGSPGKRELAHRFVDTAWTTIGLG